VLDFIHMVLVTPVLKDHTVHGPGGITSFYFYFYFYFFLINVIYFKIELKGGLNRSLDFTSPVYRCSFTLREQVISYTEERVDKLRERE
jgi:hypothetical protein